MAVASVEEMAYLARMIVREEVANLFTAFSPAEADQGPGLTWEQKAALTDVELVRALWAAADAIPDTHDRTRDRLYSVIGEALERWVPEAELAVCDEQRRPGDDTAEDDRDARAERRALREGRTK